MTKTRAHQHEYVCDTRPEWGGVVCRICGFRVPQSMVHLREVQERIVKTGDAPCSN
jgi:hypothetical protein